MKVAIISLVLIGLLGYAVFFVKTWWNVHRKQDAPLAEFRSYLDEFITSVSNEDACELQVLHSKREINIPELKVRATRVRLLIKDIKIFDAHVAACGNLKFGARSDRFRNEEAKKEFIASLERLRELAH